MTDPNNYSSAFAQTSPVQSFLQGVQGGAGIREMQMAQQQQAAQQQQQQQLRADLQELSSNPTPEAIGRAAIKYPQLSEQFKRSYDMLSSEKKNAKLQSASEVFAAINSGAPEIAVDVLKREAAAHRNAGDEQGAAGTETMIKLVQEHPEFAKTTVGLMLSSAMGPEKFADTYATLGKEGRSQDQAPADLKQANAKAEQEIAVAVGSKLGALAQAKSLKPAQVETAFKAMAAQGLIPKDQLPGYIASIPESQGELREYLNVFKAAGLKPDEQMKYTDVDANTSANNATSRANNAASNAVAIRGQNLVNQRSIEANAAKNSAEGMLTPETVKVMAEQYRSGDTSVMQNLGRGAQGAKNIIAIREEVARQNAAQGGTGADLAAKNAEFMGTKAAQRTAGTRIANVELAAREAMNLIPLARTASDEVERSGFLPFGKAGIMFDNQTNNQALRKFATANNGVVNTYARAISPSGVGTVADKEHAREMLSTAMDKKSYNAVLDQMQEEMKAALEAPQHVRQAINDSVTGRNSSGTHAPASNAPAVGSVMQGYRFKGGNPADKSNWVKQ